MNNIYKYNIYTIDYSFKKYKYDNTFNIKYIYDYIIKLCNINNYINHNSFTLVILVNVNNKGPQKINIALPLLSSLLHEDFSSQEVSKIDFINILKSNIEIQYNCYNDILNNVQILNEETIEKLLIDMTLESQEVKDIYKQIINKILNELSIEDKTNIYKKRCI